MLVGQVFVEFQLFWKRRMANGANVSLRADPMDALMSFVVSHHIVSKGTN